MLTTPVLLSLALVLTLGVAGASGQDNSGKKAQQPSTSSSVASKSRPRSVVASSSPEPTPSATDQTNASKAAEPSTESSIKRTTKAGEEPTETTGTKGIEKPIDKSTENPGDAKPPMPSAHPKGINAPPEALSSLPEQIDAAPSGPERIRLQLKLAEQLVAADKKTEAITELHAITNTDVFDPQGFYNAGNALVRLGDYDEAIKAYRKAIDQRKGNYSRALNNLGVVLLREGRWDDSYDALLSALKLESFHYAEASYNLGRLYSARGETDLAIREWRRALAVDPGHGAAAQALAGAGNKAGIVVRPEASAKGPTPTKNSMNSAKDTVVSGGSRGGSAPRGAAMTKVLTLDAVSYDFFQRARNFREHGKLPEAAEDYQKVISRSHGYFPPANLELSYVQLSLKRNDEALGNLLQVANRDGARFPASYYFLGRLYELKGDLTSAEESFARAATADKTNKSFLLDLSRVRERRGDFKGALAALEEYSAASEQQGLKPSWLDESLSVLRRKASGAQVQPK